jgi:hypothetical protein
MSVRCGYPRVAFSMYKLKPPPPRRCVLHREAPHKRVQPLAEAAQLYATEMQSDCCTKAEAHRAPERSDDATHGTSAVSTANPVFRDALARAVNSVVNYRRGAVWG